MSEPIYKILTIDEWRAALRTNAYHGAPVDVSDGYIHLSRKSQVEGTLHKHFTDQGNLMMFRFDADVFGDDLAHEEARGGELFPHLYAALNIKLADALFPILRQATGKHMLPVRY